MSSDKKYKEVIQANIELHSKMSEHYNTCEPHFRPENIEKVEQKIKQIANDTNAKRLVDFGCGTGFIINIAKKYITQITGVDVTQAMMDKIDKSGNATIELINHDTGSVALAAESFDMVTAYSFLHHLFDVTPTINNAYRCLRKGGKFYADLDPNYYFWESVNHLDRNGSYDAIVKREIEMVTYKDEDIQANFGVEKEVFNNAEFGKNIAGGFREEDLRKKLTEAGFSKIDFFYHWFIGQGPMINDASLPKEERLRYASVAEQYMQKALPVTKNIFKYVGFIATK